MLRESTRNRLICSTIIVIVSYTRSDGFVSRSDVQLQPRYRRKWVIASGRLTMAEQRIGHDCGVARVPLSEAATFQCSSRTESVESLAASGCATISGALERYDRQRRLVGVEHSAMDGSIRWSACSEYVITN